MCSGFSTQFPSFIHSQKRNPQTHMKDPDMVWDFMSLRPESLHQVIAVADSESFLEDCRKCLFCFFHLVLPVQVSFLFSDRGIPDGHRHMNGYGSHTFKLVNANGDCVYCKFHFKVG